VSLHQPAEAARIEEPALPDGLQATLLHYQADGFHWLAQLAGWGLGKTVPALALLQVAPPRSKAAPDRSSAEAARLRNGVFFARVVEDPEKLKTVLFKVIA
jgi:hypothetical protein